MGLFSKRPRHLVPAAVLSQLHPYGDACFNAVLAGRPAPDGRFGWDWLSGAMEALRTNQASGIAEIHDAACGDELAQFGGYRVIAEYDGAIKDPLYLELMDSALSLKRAAGLPSAYLTGYERDRWVAKHGDLRGF